MKNKKIITVLLLVIIGVVIIGIYFTKNPVSGEKNQPEVQLQQTKPDESQQADTEKADNEETAADFSLDVSEMIHYEELAAYGLPIIVDYGSDSCIPCKQMAPVLEKMNEEMQGKSFIKFVDVWKYPDAAGNVPVQVIPTQILVNADGSPFVPSEELAAQIEFIMYSSKDTGEHVFTVHQGGITEDQMRMILTEMGALE
jgi:thioredoxin 1